MATLSRHDISEGTAAAAIAAVEAIELSVPIEAEQQHVSDFGRIKTFDTVLVRIETQGGRVGWGEAKNAAGSAGSYSGLAALINRDFAPGLIGRDSRNIAAIWDAMYNGVRSGYAKTHGRVFPELSRRGVTVAALSAIDIALWDLLGKDLGVPVWQLLGGRRAESFPAYASGGWAPVQSIGPQLQSYVDQGGFRAVKMRVGVMDGKPEVSAARVQAAREALGPDIAIFCDAHGTFSVAEAKRFCRLVADCNIGWLEEPVAADDKAGMAIVRSATDIPIAAGESEYTRFDFRDLITSGCVDIVQPDMAVCGGISEGMRIAALASAYNLQLAPHMWGGALGFMAGLAVLASSPCGWIVEYSLGANPLMKGLINEPIRVEDGRIMLSERPGLGLTINEAFVQEHTVSPESA